jgi:predicted transcriptional regulator
MENRLQNELSKRERQIMDAIYKKKSASVKEVLDEIRDPPSYSAVRAMINILEGKGFLMHKKSGLKYIYSPTISPKKAMNSAVRQLLKTYFNDSIEEAVAAVIKTKKNLTETDYERLTGLIEASKKKG